MDSTFLTSLNFPPSPTTINPRNHSNPRQISSKPPPRRCRTTSQLRRRASDEHPRLLPRRSCALGMLAALSLMSHHIDVAEARVGVSDMTSPYLCEDVEMYYSGVEWLEGERLMMRLNSIVSGHRSLQYKEVWDALKFLDAANIDCPNASSEVIDIYSLRAVPKILAGKPEGWNREHLWPRSYGLTDATSLTDLHNIRPADANVNSSRGNKYYGECVLESTDCLRPANGEAAHDTETDKERWTPPLQVRGDIARSVMYMAVRYGFLQPGGRPHLRLSDSPSSRKQEMGHLSELLKWNEIDPPSREERLRNDRICNLYQHNRNPFIDHPEYANLIWKLGSPNHQREQNSSLSSWINKFHYDN